MRPNRDSERPVRERKSWYGRTIYAPETERSEVHFSGSGGSGLNASAGSKAPVTSPTRSRTFTRSSFWTLTPSLKSSPLSLIQMIFGLVVDSK